MRRDAVGGHKARGNACRWGSNLPNNVAASLDPVVQEGQACVGNEIGEAHVWYWFGLIACMEGENRSGVDGRRRGVRHSFSDGRRLRKNASAGPCFPALTPRHLTSTTTPLHKRYASGPFIVRRGIFIPNNLTFCDLRQLFILELVLWVLSVVVVESRRSIAELRPRLCSTPSTTNIMIPSPSPPN